MAFTYNSVGQQVTNIFGQVAGVTAAAIATNYNATLGTGTVKGPDFFPLATQDAIFDTLVEIVVAIAETPLHHERDRYNDVVYAIGNGGGLGLTGVNTGARIVGVVSKIVDSLNTTRPLIEVPLEKVRAHNLFSSTIYSGADIYWMAWSGTTLYHTRTTVDASVCCFNRPTVFTGDVPLEDFHETALIYGAIRLLSLKENMFTDLHDRAKAIFDEHIASIKAYASPALYGNAQASPAPK